MTTRWVIVLADAARNLRVGETGVHTSIVEWSEPYLHYVSYAMMGAGDYGIPVQPVGEDDVISAIVLLHRGFLTGDSLEQCLEWSKNFVKDAGRAFVESDKTTQVKKYLWPTHS